MVVSLPSGAESTRVAHGSVPELLPLLLTDTVVGKGVCVGGSVGGSGVEVGIAACVCATMVNAAATAVFCTSTACIVGAAGAPQALMSMAITATVRVEKRFILCAYLLMN